MHLKTALFIAATVAASPQMAQAIGVDGPIDLFQCVGLNSEGHVAAEFGTEALLEQDGHLTEFGQNVIAPYAEITGPYSYTVIEENIEDVRTSNNRFIQREEQKLKELGIDSPDVVDIGAFEEYKAIIHLQHEEYDTAVDAIGAYTDYILGNTDNSAEIPSCETPSV